MATTKKFRVKHGLDASNNTISFVNDPVSANDAATKNYVDIQVASAPGDVSNTYLTSTFTTNTDFQSYVANTNSRIDTLEAGGTLVTNAYLTSTFTTNTDFQSFVANTNSYIATKTDDSTVLATNTALRTLIDDRLQVGNLNTTLADYWPSANIITYTAKYLEVANSSTGTSVTVSNSAPTITANGELWWDNASGELYVSYSSNWVEAVAQDVTPYADNGTFSSSNNTITFVRTDGSQFDVVLTGVGEVTNAYVTSTFTTNTVFQSALANTNAYIATKTDDTVALATNTALRTLIDDRMQVANVEAYLANTNSYIATESARIDLVNTNLTGTNTALRTLISDRIQVANADTRFLRKDGTALQSVGGQVTFNNNVLISGNLTVSGTKTEVNTTQVNVSNTYILLNSDLGSGTAATENAGIIVNRGAEANVYFRWNETGEYWEYGEADGTFIKVSEASATTIQARNECGGTINFGQPVSVSGYSRGGERPLVELADADDPAQMPALGLALDTVSTGNNLRVATYGIITNANTGVFSVGQELYIDTVAGKLTGTRPSGDTVKVQKIGQVLRSHASAGSILIQGAGRSNDVPNLEDKHVFIGNTTNGVDTRVLVVSDISNSDTLATNAALQTEVTRIDLVNTNLTGTNTALRTLISDRLQVANAITTLAGLTDVAQVTPTDGHVLKYSSSNTTYYFAAETGGGAGGNSFSVIEVGGTLIDSAGSTARLSIDAGSGITLTPTAGNNTIVIAATGGGGGTQTFSDLAVTTFTANGTQTAFSINNDVTGAEDLIVTLDGVIQRPTTDYTFASNTVTFGTAPINGEIVAIREIKAIGQQVLSGVSNSQFQSYVANTNVRLVTLEGGGGGSSTLAGLTDVAQVTPTDGHVLKYSSANTTYYFAAESGGGGASTGTAIAMALVFG